MCVYVFYDIRYHLLDCMNKLRKYLTLPIINSWNLRMDHQINRRYFLHKIKVFSEPF